MINGAKSFQREICDDRVFYNDSLPNLKNEDIVMVEGAGHGVHFEKPAVVKHAAVQSKWLLHGGTSKPSIFHSIHSSYKMLIP